MNAYGFLVMQRIHLVRIVKVRIKQRRKVKKHCHPVRALIPRVLHPLCARRNRNVHMKIAVIKQQNGNAGAGTGRSQIQIIQMVVGDVNIRVIAMVIHVAVVMKINAKMAIIIKK